MSGNWSGTYFVRPGYTKQCFTQMIPAPNYLMNMVVGDFEYGEGEYATNTGILAEPSVLASAINEFNPLQAALNTAQDWINTTYIWGNYTVVVMPACYPEGGLASVNLNFISQTAIVGD